VSVVIKPLKAIRFSHSLCLVIIYGLFDLLHVPFTSGVLEIL
jgi:hypothetical protein